MGLGFPALRSRNYRLFFGGQELSLIGTWMTQIATVWLVYQMSFLGMVPFGNLMAGSLATRIGVPSTMLIGGCVCIVLGTPFRVICPVCGDWSSQFTNELEFCPSPLLERRSVIADAHVDSACRMRMDTACF